MQETVPAFKFSKSVGYVIVVSIVLPLIILNIPQPVNAQEIVANEAQKNNPSGTISKDSVKNLNVGSLTSTTVSTHLNTNAAWSTWFVPFESKGRHLRYLVDINGDGLSDYILLSRNRFTQGEFFRDQVYLGNGHGWKLVYNCEYNRYNGVESYSGDCASESNSGSTPQSARDGCFADYSSWPRSLVYTKNDWQNLPFFLDENITPEGWFESMLDLNGDGLTDYVYFEDNPINTFKKRCICLNNGHGWDIVYKCVYRLGDYYYGDCADVSGQNIKQNGLNLKEDVKVETKIPEK